MNEQIPQPNVRTTQFAEGLPRRSWTVAEFENIARMGLFSDGRLEDERLELLAGDIVPMSPKTPRHELLRSELHHHWATSSGYRHYKIAVLTSFVPDDDSYLFPDMSVIAEATKFTDITAQSVLLIVEVVDTDIVKDTQYKAHLYASAGVRDYWVINAATLVITMFRDPTDTGYRSREEIAPDQTMIPLHAAELAIALHELGL